MEHNIFQEYQWLARQGNQNKERTDLLCKALNFEKIEDHI